MAENISSNWNSGVSRSQDLSQIAYYQAIDLIHQLLRESSNRGGSDWLSTAPGMTTLKSLYAAAEKILNSSSDSQRHESWANFESVLNQVSIGQQSQLDYERSQLDYTRSLPENVLQHLIAAGLSPSAARSLLSGSVPQTATTSSLPSLSLGSSGLSGLQDMASLAEQAGSWFSIVIGLANLGVNAQLAAAQSNAIKAGTNLQDMQNDGFNTAREYFKVASAAKSTPFYDSSKHNSVSSMLDLIKKLGSDGDDNVFGEFVRDFIDSGKVDNPFARGSMYDSDNLNSINLDFARRMDNQTRLSSIDVSRASQELSNSAALYKNIVDENKRLNAEISNLGVSYWSIIAGTDVSIEQANLLRGQQSLIPSQKDLYDVQIKGQRISNSIASLDYRYKSATIDKLTSIELQKLQYDLQVLTCTDSDGIPKVLKTMLSDSDTAFRLSALANTGAAASQEFWSLNPELFKYYSAWSDSHIQSGLNSLASEAALEGSTITTGVEVPFGKIATVKSTSIAAYLSTINKLSNQGKLQSALSYGDSWLQLQGQTGGSFWQNPDGSPIH